jgi:multiple sugar transport system permease protein
VPAYFGSAFSIFLLRQFFLTLPSELEDAAKIDGCNPLGTWWRIILPISGPALATVGILTFMGAWSNYVGPAIYLRNDDIHPLSLGLYAIKATGQAPVEWGQLMACALAVSLPPLLIYIIKGAVTSGLAGR